MGDFFCIDEVADKHPPRPYHCCCVAQQTNQDLQVMLSLYSAMFPLGQGQTEAGQFVTWVSELLCHQVYFNTQE